MSAALAFLLPALPLLALLAFLLAGRYPGCETMVRLSERLAARGRRAHRSTRSRRPSRPPLRAAHGGLLLAHSLSGRAPPA